MPAADHNPHRDGEVGRRVLLRTLHEAARLGSMRAASDELGLEPSTISRQIARLEYAFGVGLVKRKRGKVLLTDAGRLMVEYYREVGAVKQAYFANLEALKAAERGTVVLAVGAALITDAFRTLLDEFIGRHPGLTLAVRTGGTRAIVQSIRDDEAHLGLIFHITTEPRISIRLTQPQPLQAIVAPQHRYARRQRVSLADLASQRLALPPDSFQIRQAVQEAERANGIALDCTLETDSFSLLKWFARSGHGVTVLNAAHVRDDIDAGTLVAVPIDCPVLGGTRISLISRSGRRLPPVAHALLAGTERFLKQSFPA